MLTISLAATAISISTSINSSRRTRIHKGYTDDDWNYGRDSRGRQMYPNRLDIKIDTLDNRSELYNVVDCVCKDKEEMISEKEKYRKEYVIKNYGLTQEDLQTGRKLLDKGYFNIGSFPKEPVLGERELSIKTLNKNEHQKEQYYKNLTDFVHENKNLILQGIQKIYDDIVYDDMPSLIELFNDEYHSGIVVEVQAFPFESFDRFCYNGVNLSANDQTLGKEAEMFIFGITEILMYNFYWDLKECSDYHFDYDEKTLHAAKNFLHTNILEDYIVPVVILNSDFAKFAGDIIGEKMNDPNYLDVLDKLDNYYKECAESKDRGKFMITAPEFVDNLLNPKAEVQTGRGLE